MSDHTPGPWRVRCAVNRGEDRQGTERHWFIASGAETWHDNRGHFHPDDARYVTDEYEVVALGFDRDYHFPEGGIRNEADARLIAAAPELLAACRAWALLAHDLLQETAPSDEAHVQAAIDLLDAAIAKADGR